MIIGKKEFDLKNNIYIMGILNVTPDSFSDGGEHNKVDEALFHAERMINEGADLIDVGGESTRPGYTLISDSEEIERIAPVIEGIKKNFDAPISVDTYKGNVALEAIKCGADLINDIWGLKYDDVMPGVVAESNKPYVLMHNRDNADYVDFLDDLIQDLKESLDIAKNAGISGDKIILDPGVGFATDYKQNLCILKNLSRFNELGYPMLLGASRKSVIGNTLNLPANERVEGTLVTTMLAIEAGYSFVRVHDVKENRRVIDMMKAISNC